MEHKLTPTQTHVQTCPPTSLSVSIPVATESALQPPTRPQWGTQLWRGRVLFRTAANSHTHTHTPAGHAQVTHTHRHRQTDRQTDTHTHTHTHLTTSVPPCGNLRTRQIRRGRVIQRVGPCSPPLRKHTRTHTHTHARTHTHLTTSVPPCENLKTRQVRRGRQGHQGPESRLSLAEAHCFSSYPQTQRQNCSPRGWSFLC